MSQSKGASETIKTSEGTSEQGTTREKGTTSERYYNKRKFNHKSPSKKFIKRTFYDKSDDESVGIDPYEGPVNIPSKTLRKYQRGTGLDDTGIKNKEIKWTEKKIKASVRQAAQTELLLAEEPGFIEPDENEDTYRIQQRDIAAASDITSAAKSFSLSLTEFGPYKLNYSRDGRFLLLGGRRGHIAALDWVTKKLLCEMNVMESLHAIQWLHLPTMFAAAQKNWVHVYDSKGIELHCVKKLDRVIQMEFLPYHFLLATSNEKSFLSWLDISVGQMVKQTYTNAGRLNILCQNPQNGVIATGHANGSVSMWSPNEEKPLVRMLCHQHPVRSIAIDSKGLYMATASLDRSLRIFDVRTYKCLQSYRIGSAASFLDFSQMDILAVGMQNVVEVYKDCCSKTVSVPYLRHKSTSAISGVQFCPYEDILGVGSSSGFNSLLIPGAGQPNFDAFESNPFMTKTQRREMEVKSLLEKIQPELITLNPNELGSVNRESLKQDIDRKKSLLYVKTPHIEFEPRHKTKSRSKSAHVFRRKIIVKEAAKRNKIKSILKKPQPKEEEKIKVQARPTQPRSALDRFTKK